MKCPDGYVIVRQSKHYLYGWNWQSRDRRKGLGYNTKKSATEAAVRDADPELRRQADIDYINLRMAVPGQGRDP